MKLILNLRDECYRASIYFVAFDVSAVQSSTLLRNWGRATWALWIDGLTQVMLGPLLLTGRYWRRASSQRAGRAWWVPSLNCRSASKLQQSAPLLSRRRGGCTIKKSREASLVRADGVVWSRNFLTTPPRPLHQRRLRCFFLMSPPPLLGACPCNRQNAVFGGSERLAHIAIVVCRPNVREIFWPKYYLDRLLSRRREFAQLLCVFTSSLFNALQGGRSSSGWHPC